MDSTQPNGEGEWMRERLEQYVTWQRQYVTVAGMRDHVVFDCGPFAPIALAKAKRLVAFWNLHLSDSTADLERRATREQQAKLTDEQLTAWKYERMTAIMLRLRMTPRQRMMDYIEEVIDQIVIGCADINDINWPAELHLGDVVEKHLVRPLLESATREQFHAETNRMLMERCDRLEAALQAWVDYCEEIHPKNREYHADRITQSRAALAKSPAPSDLPTTNTQL